MKSIHIAEMRLTVRCILVCKAVRPCNARKTCRAGDNNTVCTAAAMNDQEIAVCILTADDTDMGIVRIEHQIARLCVVP